MKSILTGKKILVTGGSGSIGKEIVKQSLSNGASFVRIFSNDENGLYETEIEFGKSKKIEYVIGDIRNSEIVESIVQDIDIVFHTAALKHVDQCELNPFEAITINIIGTKNICRSAIKSSVSKVINISTDKAVNPIGVLGSTKLLTEKLIAAESSHSNDKTIFSSVRFGNVLNTRGSIIPRIENQILSGGPVTLTDKRMVRFFMTKSQAVDLIFEATEFAKGGETFILKMPMILLDDLFETMKDILSKKYNLISTSIETKIIGIRPGEKIIEYLLTDFEMEHVLETEKFFIMPSMFTPIKDRKYSNAKKPKNLENYFKNLKPISKNEIKSMLKEIY